METEKEHAIKEINKALTLLANVCRSKDKYGKEKDAATVRSALDSFSYTVIEFIECLPDHVVELIEKRRELANKMANELIEKLNKRPNGWSI